MTTKYTPRPDLLPGNRGDHGRTKKPWQVQHQAHGGTTNFGTRLMTAPIENDDQDSLNTMLHEMLHARFTETKIPQKMLDRKPGLTNALLGHVEDARIHLCGQREGCELGGTGYGQDTVDHLEASIKNGKLTPVHTALALVCNGNTPGEQQVRELIKRALASPDFASSAGTREQYEACVMVGEAALAAVRALPYQTNTQDACDIGLKAQKAFDAVQKGWNPPADPQGPEPQGQPTNDDSDDDSDDDDGETQGPPQGSNDTDDGDNDSSDDSSSDDDADDDSDDDAEQGHGRDTVPADDQTEDTAQGSGDADDDSDGTRCGSGVIPLDDMLKDLDSDHDGGDPDQVDGKGWTEHDTRDHNLPLALRQVSRKAETLETRTRRLAEMRLKEEQKAAEATTARGAYCGTFHTLDWRTGEVSEVSYDTAQKAATQQRHLDKALCRLDNYDACSSAWGTMIVNRVPLPHKVPTSWKRPRRATKDTGCIPTSMHNLCVDRKIFADQTNRSGTPSILLDMSGSMSLNMEQVENIVKQNASAVIASYSGSRSNGRGGFGVLRIIADGSGHYAATHHLRAPGGYDNYCDGIAMRWLSKQTMPRIWVSDGGITAPHADWTVTHKDIGADCHALCDDHAIRQIPTPDDTESYLKELSKRGKVFLTHPRSLRKAGRNVCRDIGLAKSSPDVGKKY